MARQNNLLGPAGIHTQDRLSTSHLPLSHWGHVMLSAQGRLTSLITWLRLPHHALSHTYNDQGQIQELERGC